MQGAPCYLKGLDRKSIPRASGAGRPDSLFDDYGEVPGAKGMKKCFITVSLAGITFYRPPKFSETTFISTYDVTEIARNSKTRRTISTKHISIQFGCDHADETIRIVLSARRLLFRAITDPMPIKLRDMGDFQPQLTDWPIPPDNLPQLRYMCLCLRYEDDANANVSALLQSIDPQKNRTLVIDEQNPCPPTLDALATPLIHINGFTVAHFRGFEPHVVCRLAHKLLKCGGSIRTVVFDNYTTLVPSQLRLQKVRFPEPLSFVFQKCNLDSTVFADLLRELANFTGEYQRITFNQFRMTVDGMSEFVAQVGGARCFRTLEVLELENLQVKGLANEFVEGQVKRLLEHCRFLQRLSLSRWTSPLPLTMRLFSSMNILTELSLQLHDMSDPFPDINFPPYIRSVNFSGCLFTFESLKSLFDILARHNKTITLIMQDLVSLDGNVSNFFSQPGVTLTPLGCVHELDWSGNYLSSATVPRFINFFFEARTIRYLAIDRIFTFSSLRDFRTMISELKPYRLWGVSVGGSGDVNFSGHFREMLRLIATLREVAILHLNGQKMTDTDSEELMTFLGKHRHVQEVSVNGSAFSSETALSKFYRRLIDSGLRAVGRPLVDVGKICADPAKMKVYARSLREMAGLFQGVHISVNQTIRSVFFTGLDRGARPNPDDLYRFSDRFPQCFSFSTSTSKRKLLHTKRK
jgi:hypothetical protein